MKLISEKIKNTECDKIAGFTGDLTNMETLFIAKEFFNKVINSKNLESRTKNSYINTSKRENYLFNSSINGIENSDLILLIGANPRFEATILNARIRKSFINNKTKIYSFGNIGDQTYPYEVLKNSTETIKDLVEKKIKLSDQIIKAQNPIIIIGQSTLKLKSSEYICESIMKFLKDNNKINSEWNAFNILSNNASTIASYDFGIISSNYSNNVLSKLNNGQFELVFLFGQDDLTFNKKKEFIVYIGSHGDKGAEIADIILPGAAFTEQDAHYTNLEGHVQKAYQASYPPGNAKEDWEIINSLSLMIKNKKIYQNKDELVDSMFNFLKMKKPNQINAAQDSIFVSESIVLDPVDYYYSNVIARSSYTMTQCRNEKLKVKKTGTEG